MDIQISLIAALDENRVIGYKTPYPGIYRPICGILKN